MNLEDMNEDEFCSLHYSGNLFERKQMTLFIKSIIDNKNACVTIRGGQVFDVAHS